MQKVDRQMFPPKAKTHYKHTLQLYKNCKIILNRFNKGKPAGHDQPTKNLTKPPSSHKNDHINVAYTNALQKTVKT